MAQVDMFLIHYDAPDWIRPSCNSVLLSDIDVSLTVVDNSDCPLELDDRVRVIHLSENAGYTGGANVGLRHFLAGNAEFCVVGSHDLHVASNTLSLLAAALRSNRQLGIVGPVITQDGSMPEPSPGVLDAVDWLPGSCLMFRRECIEGIGLFDEKFGSYCEDVDICWRAADQGWGVARVGGAVAYGLGSSSMRAKRLMEGNAILLNIKHRGRFSAIKRLAFYIVIRIPLELLRGHWIRAKEYALAVPIGLRHIWKEMRLG